MCTLHIESQCKLDAFAIRRLSWASVGFYSRAVKTLSKSLKFKKICIADVGRKFCVHAQILGRWGKYLSAGGFITSFIVAKMTYDKGITGCIKIAKKLLDIEPALY